MTPFDDQGTHDMGGVRNGFFSEVTGSAGWEVGKDESECSRRLKNKESREMRKKKK